MFEHTTLSIECIKHCRGHSMADVFTVQALVYKLFQRQICLTYYWKMKNQLTITIPIRTQR